MTVSNQLAMPLFAVASVALAADPPADLIKELSAMKGSVAATGTPSSTPTLFTRLREHSEEIGDVDRNLFMPILGGCLTSAMPEDAPDCSEFDAKDLAERAAAARQRLKGTLVRWALNFDNGPASSEFSLGQFDFAKRVFPVAVKAKLCNGTLGDRCVVPANPGLVREAPAFEIRFEVPIKDAALARAIAALRPEQPGVTWAPTVEILFMPTGRSAAQAFRKRQRVEDWIGAQLVALRVVIDVPASVGASKRSPPDGESPDEDAAAPTDTVEIVLADYYFR